MVADIFNTMQRYTDRRINMTFSDKQITEILDALRTEYPDAGCALTHRNTYQLIVAVVLSAQTTD